MYEQVLESFRKATESNVQMQQELFKKWFGLWPGVPAAPVNFGEHAKQFQKNWAETFNETIKRQQELADKQFKIGLENIEKAFQLGEAKTPEELRTKTLELWKACFTGLKQAYEAQFNSFQAGVQKWTELMSKPG
jgi:hypothetical protein